MYGLLDGPIAGGDKRKRDMLIFYWWKNPVMGNRQIREMFALSYLSVSKIVKKFRKQYEKNRKLVRRYAAVVTQFKV